MDRSELSAIWRSLHHQHRMCHHHIAADLGLYYGQPMVLLILSCDPGLSLADLAERINITPASVTVSVGRMEKSGLIEKIPDPEDHRRYALRLTEKGEELACRCRERLDRVDEVMYADFTPRERETFSALCRRMENNLKRFEEEGRL